MHEITRVALENDMDLILANRQSMKLAELCKLSLAAQTSFATAVSEVCRNAIDISENASVILGINIHKNKDKHIIAIICDYRKTASNKYDEGYKYAKKLVETIELTKKNEETKIELRFKIPAIVHINEDILHRWQLLLNNDPAVSPYEEIKRKNRQLLAMADLLKASENTYRTLTDSLPIMIFTMNNEGQLTYANQWLLNYTGQTIDTINATRWANALHKDDITNATPLFVQAMQGDTAWSSESRFRDNNSGEYRWHTGVLTPVKDESDTVMYWNAFMVDVDARKRIQQTLKDNTELKETKNELEQKIAELKRSNEELAQFAYVASHDLQEPLRKIRFYTDYIQKRFTTELPLASLPYLDNISNSSARMNQLILDVLTYSTINTAYDFQDVSLNEIIEQAIHDLEITVSEKQATISYQPLPVIAGNELQLRQLIENLLSNSLKFSLPSRPPVINITGQTENGMLIITFEDNGIGFEAEHIDKMFDLFQRLHTRDKYTGTGIGLGICKKIVKIHKGEITASSVPGQGATFTVTLPLKQLN